jgi:hypothetical protein
VVIIQRLDQIELLLQQQQQQQNQVKGAGSAIDRIDDFANITLNSAVTASDSPTLHGSPRYQVAASDFSRLTIETILSWSVFEAKYDSYTSLRDFASSPTTSSQEPFLANSDPRHERLDLDLRTCTRLLHTFLEEVHIANPILDVPLVTDYLYQACVHGIGWDAPSCLVVRLPT